MRWQWYGFPHDLVPSDTHKGLSPSELLYIKIHEAGSSYMETYTRLYNCRYVSVLAYRYTQTYKHIHITSCYQNLDEQNWDPHDKAMFHLFKFLNHLWVCDRKEDDILEAPYWCICSKLITRFPLLLCTPDQLIVSGSGQQRGIFQFHWI